MNIPLLSVAMSQGYVKQQVSMAMMKQSMEQAEVTSDGLMKMLDSVDVRSIQRAAEPHLGSTIDIRL